MKACGVHGGKALRTFTFDTACDRWASLTVRFNQINGLGGVQNLDSRQFILCSKN